MVVVIDNYDSFTYNLVQYIGELGNTVRVFRNDEISVDDILKIAPRHLVISPGPCTPLEAGISVQVIRKLGNRIPILGVCLGHQSIGYAFGARIVKGGEPVHGKTSVIQHNGKRLFDGLPQNFTATRYHSLVIDRKSLPDCLDVTAMTKDGVIMGISHKNLKVDGVQFHPESILSENGHSLLKNFLRG